MAEKKKLTPMLEQYFRIKKEHEDSVLMFRLGDFYEMFGEDAKTAAGILNIALTARGKGSENEMPMCGIPHHALNNYLPKLTKAGQSVAICEQVSDPSLPGIVQREVARIVTPGTVLDPETLSSTQNNYLASIHKLKENWALAFCDLTTGDFKLMETKELNILENELFKISPSEILLPENLFEHPKLLEKLQFYYYKIYDIPSWEEAETILLEHFKTKNFHGFGVTHYKAGLEAAGRILQYLKDTQKTTLHHINKLSLHHYHDYMMLDKDTINNLELLETAKEHDTKSSFFSIINYSSTAMGSRLLYQWMLTPLLDKQKIENRLNAVEELFFSHEKRKALQESLKKVSDLERIIGRIGCRRCNAKDLVSLKQTLEKIPSLKEEISVFKSKEISSIYKHLKIPESIFSLIEKSILEDPSSHINEGRMIKDGYNEELDELRGVSSSGKNWIAKYQKEEIEKTGISTLKVKFNKVFGYHIEISKGSADKAPENYQRKQTLTNAERFTTPELKEYEQKILGAEDKIIELELKLFREIVEKICEGLDKLQTQAALLSKLDCYTGMAQCAVANQYTKPKITDNDRLEIKDGRHPVIEYLLKQENYVPNNTLLDNKDHQFILLTGPNMAGKSSYIRQVALITLMAQMGSFVPASAAEISVVDRIFTRVGAQDNLTQGQSTFMVEMQEAANIINNATPKSLIILDELGRGTSTYDGVSIAWAITEYIHNHICAKTIFATHYHELIEIADQMHQAQNYSIAVTEDRGDVIFLRKVINGGINKSYGIAVAKLAGMPQEIIHRAESILKKFEADGMKERPEPHAGQSSLPLFSAPQIETNPILEELKETNINNLTPLEAMQKLHDFIEKAKKIEE